jgi:hypothetical protein
LILKRSKVEQYDTYPGELISFVTPRQTLKNTTWTNLEVIIFQIEIPAILEVLKKRLVLVPLDGISKIFEIGEAHPQ